LQSFVGRIAAIGSMLELRIPEYYQHWQSSCEKATARAYFRDVLLLLVLFDSGIGEIESDKTLLSVPAGLAGAEE